MDLRPENDFDIFAHLTLIFDLLMGHIILTTPLKRKFIFPSLVVPRFTCVPNLKCLSSRVPEDKGTHILKSGSRDPDHAPVRANLSFVG